MFRYYLKLGALSLRHNPVLTALMVAAIATGIGACMTIANIHYVMGGNPIPHRSDVLFHVQLDNWDPYNAARDPDEPPNQLTYRDGTTLLAAGRARRQVLSYKTWRVVQPDDPEQLPFQVQTRSTSADFFPMFDTPFLYGSGWSQTEDDNGEYVTVLSRETNEKLFGGENSVGKMVVMNGSHYRVTGVLDTWEPMPKFYDLNNQTFGAPEEAYFPISVSFANELHSSGNTNCWKPTDGNGWTAFINSECVWLQFWVELHGEQERQAYLDYVDAYVMSQKDLGRFPRPLNNRLSNVEEWMVIENVVDDDVDVLLGLAVLFLIVCLLNTIGLLLAKIMRRAGDISLRRALGASKQAIFSQYIIEAGIVGLGGGIVGIGMTWLGLQGIRYLFGDFDYIARLIAMDWVMISAAIVLAIVSALAAAVYPTWRACRIHPASQLKTI